jgi:hypothetical protein
MVNLCGGEADNCKSFSNQRPLIRREPGRVDHLLCPDSSPHKARGHQPQDTDGLGRSTSLRRRGVAIRPKTPLLVKPLAGPAFLPGRVPTP